MRPPDLSFALPMGSEARWSDLLAVLIATDPAPFAAALGLHHDPSVLMVHREVAVDSANRPDIVLAADGVRVAVIEVKVLAGLGTRQLAGYQTAAPGADVYALLYPQRLVIDLADAHPWRGLTWETILTVYAHSRHQWVATTARAWLRHLDIALPKVGPETIWNDLSPGEDFIIALRARMSWLFDHIRPPAGIECDLVSSDAGQDAAWIVKLRAETPAVGYAIVVELEENLSVRDYPKYFAADGRQPRGPTAKICLCQEGITTSAGFDWDYLLRLWPVMKQARSDWVRNPAQPKAAHDRGGHKQIIAAGAPPYLGIGFGEAQAKRSGFCMFGARIQFPADITLAGLSAEVGKLSDLTLDLARIGQHQPLKARLAANVSIRRLPGSGIMPSAET
jgi:hypothetical protein